MGNSKSRTSRPDQPPPYSEEDGRGILQEYESDPDMKSEAFSTLKKYDTVVVLDDSGSMTAKTHKGGESRWEAVMLLFQLRWNEINWLYLQAKDALACLAEDAGKYDTDGIDIYFLNHVPASDNTGMNLTTASQVRRFIDQASPTGGTPIGAKLDEILSAYMRQLRNAGRSDKPPKFLNVLVITDGGATDRQHLKEVIAQTTRNLDEGFYPLRQIGIQFIQIGRANDATAFLTALDDDLTSTGAKEQRATRDIVDTVLCSTKGGKFTAALLLKILTGGIDRAVDNENVQQISTGRSRMADLLGSRKGRKEKYCY
ncbi:hypothetical protein CPB85DRAFT_1445568 [Mucidula mucida]|nr:hypothetical protein CPB85DRAFT_1445568 [Mucidula mucida]